MQGSLPWPLLNAGSSDRCSMTAGTHLPERGLYQTLDKTHAACANIDLDFSKIFETCLNQKMEGIYISTKAMR